MLANDIVNFATLTSYQANTTQGGTVVLVASGAFTYTPPAGFVSPPNDTFTYTLSNALGNSSATAAITVFPPPPDAVNDAYNVTGNIQISVPASGVLANDTLNTGTLTSASTTSANGGNVAVNANGSFTYNPPVGFEGTDTFTYTLTNITASDTATVTLTVNDVVWFVDNTAGAGDGRLGTPYNNLGSLQGADSDESGDVIFVYQGSGNYTGGLPLEASQALIGQGVSLSSALTALGITLAPNSAALPGTAGNPTIVNVGGDALTLSTNNTVRGVTLGNASGTSLSGSGFGTLTADTVTINNTTGAAITLTTGTANVTFASVSSTGGVNGVNLNGVGGTLTLGTGALSGATGATFNVVGGTATVTYSGNLTQANNAALVSVSGGHNTGTLTFQTGTLNATNGAGLQFDNADGTYNFNGTNTLGGGDAGIDILNGSTGTFSFSGNSSITNPSGTAFNLDASNANVTYSGSLSDNSGFVVDINNHDAGTVTFQTGTLNSTAQGVRVQNSNAGSVIFANATKTLNTGANAAVTLSSNTGGTITFSNGGLGITTTTATGFSAIGGGTVNVTGAINTINSTNGTALNVTNTTIGASGLTFLSISSIGGTTPGIVLNTTGASGGLTVTGDGGGANNGSGGTISNKTGNSETTGTPGVRLFSVANVRLNYMNITGNNHSGIYGGLVSNPSGAIDSSTINGFQLNRSNITGNGDTGTSNPDETGVDLYNLVGTAGGGANPTSIINTTISNNFEFELQITNSTATALTDLQMSGNTLSSNTAAAGHGNLFNFLGAGGGSANMTLNLTSGTFTGNAPFTATGVQCDHSGSGGTMTCNISGATFTNNNVGPQASVAGNGQMVFDFNGNTVTGSRSHGINLFADANPPFTKSITGRIRNNIVGTFGVSGSGSSVGFPIRVQNEGRIPMTLEITGNVVQESTSFTGININVGITTMAGSAATNATITGNTIREIDSGRAIAVQQNDHLPAGGNAGTVCANISGNIISNVAGQAGDGTYLRVRRSDSSTTQVFNVRQAMPTGAANPSELDDANGFNDPARVSIGGTPTFSAGTCTQPPLVNLPNNVNQSVAATGVAVLSDSQPQFAPMLAGGTVLANIGTLPAGKSVTIIFDVTIANPLPNGVTQLSNQGSFSGNNFATVLTDDPDTSAPGDPTITLIGVTITTRTLYLPLVMKGFVNAADLVVQSLSLSGATAQVVIRNQGTVAVTDEFYVDLYVNPSPVPTSVNQIWPDLATRGAVWGVTASALPALQPGGVITLTVGDAYYIPALSNLAGPISPGTPVYAQVDSANAGVSTGAVLENHELSGGAYNNITGSVSTVAFGGSAPTTTSVPATERAALPPRP